MKIEVFWDVMLCHWVYSPVELHRDSSVNPSDTTLHLRRLNLQQCYCENLISHSVDVDNVDSVDLHV